MSCFVSYRHVEAPESVVVSGEVTYARMYVFLDLPLGWYVREGHRDISDICFSLPRRIANCPMRGTLSNGCGPTAAAAVACMRPWTYEERMRSGSCSTMRALSRCSFRIPSRPVSTSSIVILSLELCGFILGIPAKEERRRLAAWLLKPFRSPVNSLAYIELVANGPQTQVEAA
jgi:hypothetical protein